MDFQIVPSGVKEEYLAAVKRIRRGEHNRSKLLDTFLKGEVIFIPITSETEKMTSSRLSSYYEVARRYGKVFTKTKINYEGTDGYLCWFISTEEETGV